MPTGDERLVPHLRETNHSDRAAPQRDLTASQLGTSNPNPGTHWPVRR